MPRIRQALPLALSKMKVRRAFAKHRVHCASAGALSVVGRRVVPICSDGFLVVPRISPNHDPRKSPVRQSESILPCPYVCRRCRCGLTPFNMHFSRSTSAGFVCESCHLIEAREARARYYRRHHSQMLEQARERNRKLKEDNLVNPFYLKKKRRALQAIVAGGLDKITGREELKCANCGCNDLFFLQVNHLNGNGNVEIKSWGGKIKTMSIAVLQGRPVQDLNILCAVCNILEYLKRRYPGRPHYPEVIWGASS